MLKFAYKAVFRSGREKLASMPRHRDLWCLDGFVQEEKNFEPGTINYRGEFTREMKQDLKVVVSECVENFADKDPIDYGEMIEEMMCMDSFLDAEISVEEFYDGFLQEMVRRIDLALQAQHAK